MFKRTSEESWDGIKKIRELYPQLSEKQAIKINGEITAYIAQDDRNKEQDVSVILDIISQSITIDIDPSGHFKNCQDLVDRYSENSNCYQLGENLWAPLLYFFSVISLFSDAICFWQTQWTCIVTVSLLCVLLFTGFLWRVLEKTTKKALLQQASAKTIENKLRPFAPKLKLFGFVSAHYAASISFLIYVGYYLWKTLMLTCEFSIEMQVLSLVSYGIFALVYISSLIYKRYKCYLEIQKKYLDK